MISYEFHAGDKFNLIDGTDIFEGKVAYVSHVKPYYVFINIDNCYQHEWVYTREELIKAIEDKRITVGKYDFTKPEKKNKIEPLEACKPVYAKKMGYIFTIKAEDYPDKQGCAIIEKKLVDVIVGWEHPSNDKLVEKINEIIAYINKKEE